MTFLSTPILHHLGEGAALVLDAFRMMAVGGETGAVVAAFDARLGPPGRLALGALHLFVHEIGAADGRRLKIACPGCCRLTGDELSVIGLLSAAQARDTARVDAHLVWLFAGRESDTARAAALAFGRLFRGAHLVIDGAPRETPETPGLAAFPGARAAGTA